MVADATKKFIQITTDRSCRKKLSDTDKDILNLVEGTDVPLLSTQKPPKGRSTLTVGQSAPTLPATTSAQAQKSLAPPVYGSTENLTPAKAQKSLAPTVYSSTKTLTPAQASTRGPSTAGATSATRTSSIGKNKHVISSNVIP